MKAPLSATNIRPNASRILLWGLVVAAVLALIIVFTLHRRNSTKVASDPYAAVPFRPQLTYKLPDVIVKNTEREPYLDTRLTIYVGWTPYRVWLGTLAPGETATRPLRAFTDEQGRSFDPATLKAEHLEVRARMGGYEVHKDFPPPR